MCVICSLNKVLLEQGPRSVLYRRYEFIIKAINKLKVMLNNKA